jgi:fructosamine-3-kinase
MPPDAQPGGASCPITMPADLTIRRELNLLGRGEGVASLTPLSGGVIADAWLVTYGDGSRVVGKTLTGAAKDVFRAEAEGLAALEATGQVRTPAVLAATGRLLLLEALAPLRDTAHYWDQFARDLAGLHSGTVHDRFGWHQDGYLGRLRQHNTWTGDGHAFFAEQRLLRYLSEPLARQALASADRRALERLCDRLPEIVPAMPPVLTHGDLWSGNLLAAPDGRPAVIDPAVSYTWAEVDLSMMWCGGRPPGSARFFDAYQELNPSPAGWQKRMPVLFLRELMSTLAHEPDSWGAAEYVRTVLAPFRTR